MRRFNSKPKNYTYIIEGIHINKSLLKKYLNKEGQKKLAIINDLSQLSTKTDNELLKVLEQMMKSKQYFKYCSSLLININPGPNYIYNYLNLKNWISSSSLVKNAPEKNPHLYSFMKYVYDAMIKENKDQVVNILGPIGSGKTFNLIHIIEYFTAMYGPNNYQTELFELFHNSIQLIHIFGSIYRENNIESTACGLLINLGFNQNNVICSFGIEPQILDFSLPFSENGRSFSILHAFIKGANDELKKCCKVPESDEYLSFFNKFLSKFSEKIREKLTLNDLEIWNRFYSLSKFFNFTPDEIIDIMKCLALILNLNELTISKVQVIEKKKKNEEKDEKVKNEKEKKEKIDKKDKSARKDKSEKKEMDDITDEENNEKEKNEIKEFFEIQKGKTFKKICDNLNIKIEDFLKCLYRFKTLREAKTFIISFMKQTYYIVFDFVLSKIRDHVDLYFTHLNKRIGTNNFKRRKNIYFIDFPADIEDKTLGGFTINIANECLNMYSASGFYEISEKLIRENINLHKFYPIKSYFAVSTCMEKGGLLEHFTKQLNKQNYNSLVNNCVSKKNFMNCIKFKEKKTFEENDFNFTYTFSHKKIEYNYESLFYESKSLLQNEVITKIYSLTKNYVIKSTYNGILVNNSRDFYSFFTSALCKIFEPIHDIKPFIVFCFHSNNSYKIFFKDRDKQNKETMNEKDIKKTVSNESNININKKVKNLNLFALAKEGEIPRELTLDMLKNSFIFPILFWNWYGYKEWITIDEYINEYSIDFEKVKNRIIQINNMDPTRKKFESNINIDFTQLPKEEVAKCTLSILSREGDFLIGKNYILMKQGTLKRMRLYLNRMIDTASKMNQNLKEKLNSIRNKEKEKSMKGKNFTARSKKSEHKSNRAHKSSPKKDNNQPKFEEIPLPEKKIFQPLNEDNSRIHLLKDQCLLNIISEGKILNDVEKQKIMKSKSFNLYYLISHREKVLSGLENDSRDDIDLEELQLNFEKKDNMANIDDSSSIRTKRSYDKNKNKSKLNKYTKNINSIIKIQSQVRRMISKEKYIILKYINSEIVLIEKFIRGHLTRVKFGKFLDCLNKIIRIQRMYHKRHILRNNCVKKLQRFWIKKVKSRKLKEKIFSRKRAKAKGEYYNYNNETFEEFFNHKNNDKEKDKQKLTKKLIKETDPNKIVDILLFAGEGKKKQTRAQKYDVNLKIEDKLLNQGELMKKSKQDLAKKYQKNFSDNNRFMPKISENVNDILYNKYPENFLERMDYYKTLKEKSLEELKQDKNYNKKKENIKNDEDNDSNKEIKETKEIKEIKQQKNKNYDNYMKNMFDRLHNEQIQIAKNKKGKTINSNNYEDNKTSNEQKERTIDDNINSNELKDNKKEMKKNKNKNKMTLKELLLSDKIKQIYRNSSVGNFNNNKNEIWPKDMKNEYLSKFKEKDEESQSSINLNNKNSSFEDFL